MSEKYQVMPDLTDAEYQELKADIAERGVMVPIEFDEDGNVLDGHHRLRACEELGIKDYPKVIRAGMSEAEKLAHARKLNMIRRHLTKEQRDELIEQQLKETPELSDRRIAESLGVDNHTVAARRSDLESDGEILSADDRIEKAIAENPQLSNRKIAEIAGVSASTVDRKKRNASYEEFPHMTQSEEPRKTVTIWNPTPREERALKDDRVIERMKETGASAVSARQKIQAEAKAERKAYTLEKEMPEGALKLFTANIQNGLPDIADNSIDFIITDPPYPKDYLGLYGDLAMLAVRVLKPGGSLIAMCGQSYLPTIYMMLDAALDYYWTCAYMTPGKGSPHLWQKRVSTYWKPLLWFTKGNYTGEFVGDVFTSPADDLDKSYHVWGQTVGGMAEIIEKFTNPGDTILDPFVGGGATGVAAIMQGRRFIGTDIDGLCVKTSKERILNTYGEYRENRDA